MKFTIGVRGIKDKSLENTIMKTFEYFATVNKHRGELIEKNKIRKEINQLLQELVDQCNEFLGKPVLKLTYTPPKKLDILLELKEKYSITYLSNLNTEITYYSTETFEDTLLFLHGLLVGLTLIN